MYKDFLRPFIYSAFIVCGLAIPSYASSSSSSVGEDLSSSKVTHSLTTLLIKENSEPVFTPNFQGLKAGDLLEVLDRRAKIMGSGIPPQITYGTIDRIKYYFPTLNKLPDVIVKNFSDIKYDNLFLTYAVTQGPRELYFEGSCEASDGKGKLEIRMSVYLTPLDPYKQ